jgi:radical SAM superfamily enzyme YgiQ (UPF0313 family)
VKILFIHKDTVVKPLGIMYLAAALKKDGHEVRVTSTSPRGEFITFKPDLVGYSVMTGSQNQFFEIDRELQKEGKHPTIWGGPHPTFFPEMETDGVIFRGECEESLPVFLKCGIMDEIGYIENIDSLEWPDRSVIPHGKVEYFITSRGCPFDCSYCFNQKWSELHGKKRVRFRDVADVVAEVKTVNPEFVHFQDDSFGIQGDWLANFAKTYPKIPFHCHLRPNTVTERMIRLLKESGVYSVRVGFETASQSLRNDVLNRGISFEQTDYCIELLKKYEIPFMIQNMIGIPGGKIQDDLETMKANIKWEPDYAWCSIYQPYPGTELERKCREWNLYDGKELSPSFFDQTHLNFDDRYKEQLRVLQKIFGAMVNGKYSNQLADVFTNYKLEAENRLFGFDLEG